MGDFRMDSFRHVIDNDGATVAERLRRSLQGADAFDFVSAYFSIYGYQLLADELDRLGSVRFLYGDPISVDELDPGAKEPKSFTPTEKGWSRTTRCSRSIWPSDAPTGCGRNPFPYGL